MTIARQLREPDATNQHTMTNAKSGYVISHPNFNFGSPYYLNPHASPRKFTIQGVDGTVSIKFLFKYLDYSSVCKPSSLVVLTITNGSTNTLAPSETCEPEYIVHPNSANAVEFDLTFSSSDKLYGGFFLFYEGKYYNCAIICIIV